MIPDDVIRDFRNLARKSIRTMRWRNQHCAYDEQDLIQDACLEALEVQARYGDECRPGLMNNAGSFRIYKTMRHENGQAKWRANTKTIEKETDEPAILVRRAKELWEESEFADQLPERQSVLEILCEKLSPVDYMIVTQFLDPDHQVVEALGEKRRTVPKNTEVASGLGVGWRRVVRAVRNAREVLTERRPS